MIEAIIAGIGAGLVLALLTGPVFFALIKTSIEKGFHAGVAMALGVVTSDVVFVGAILFGSQFFDFTIDPRILGYVGSGILVTIGLYYIFKKADIKYKNSPKKIKRAGFFFKGFLMCIFNPSLLFHWITVIGAASTLFHRGVPGSVGKTAVMFLTILIVQFGLDVTKAFYANKLRDRISEKMVHRLNQVAGLALIIAAFVIIDRLITHFIFSPQ
ncbi:threonine/homoserine/homoserine lactone efflux protein [Mucilaginibacter gracilis]|uniref:Threonine/homoserine/homoserine lactone efflux protein n=1 Tax=Mucilaginibacter gracilis TaxID=423350 RepID=A0A495J1H0_9SPHI|nr:LysE family transporter [Mucilaginibacter gracilis]RKR82572.1 threonine/homoserine/homoserine lactone efflux protein [Mucilaginibacter gracilis]